MGSYQLIDCDLTQMVRTTSCSAHHILAAWHWQCLNIKQKQDWADPRPPHPRPPHPRPPHCPPRPPPPCFQETLQTIVRSSKIGSPGIHCQDRASSSNPISQTLLTILYV